jgi:hypothetical protein
MGTIVLSGVEWNSRRCPWPMGIYTGVYIGLLPTSILDPSKGITLMSDFEARAISMPAGTGPFSLIHATIKKFGHNMSLTANDHAAELINVERIVEDILTNAAQSRKDKMVDDRMQYHMGAVFLT